MTEREAIKLLSEIRDSEYVKYMGIKTAVFNEKAIEAFDLAISALEKQTPRTVCTQFDRWHNYFLHFCPVCGGLVREYEYCSDCGQKLSYGDEAEEEDE